jgi:YVTN family beta-propeller protein
MVRIRLTLLLAAALLIPACGKGGSTPPPPPVPAPGAFTLTSPSAGATNRPLQPTFTWTASSDAASYRLEVATDSGFAGIALDQAGVAAPTFTPSSDLARATDYWWRVTAVNASGQVVATNAPRTFRTIPFPPEVFSQLAPEAGQAFVGTTPKFEWTASAGADTFTFQLSTFTDFSVLVQSAFLTSATLSLNSTALSPAMTYYWRVIADNPGGSTTAGPRSFTTEPVLGTVHARTGTLVDLAFDAGRNRVYLSNNTNGTVEVFDVGTSSFLAPVAVGADPRGMDLTPDGSRLIVCMAGARNLAVLDLSVTPPVVERTVALPLEYAWETPVPYTVACTANGKAFVGLANTSAYLREITLATWAGAVRSDCRPLTSVAGPAFGVNAARTRLVTADYGISGGSWWHYSTVTNVFTEVAFDEGTSYTAAVNAGGTLAGFTDRIINVNGLTEAGFSDGHWKLLFHPDGARAVRILRDERFVKISDLQTYGDLDVLNTPSDMMGPATLNGTGDTLFGIAVGGLLVLPIPADRPPVLEPMGRLLVTPGRSLSARAIARDPEGGAVTLSAGSLPPNTTFNPATGLLQFSPDNSQAGKKYVVWIRASDGVQTTMSRADLEVRSSAAPVVNLLPIDGTIGRLSFDASRNRLYASNTDRNRIEVIDVAASSRLAPIPVGDAPVGIDQNAGSTRLVVCPFGTDYIEVVDLTAVPPVRVIRAAIPDTAQTMVRHPWEVGVAANGKALFASSYGGNATTAVWELAVATGSVAARADVPDSFSHIREPGSFATSVDRGRIFIGAGDISSGSVHRYQSSTDSFLARVDTGRFFIQLSTNQDGSRMGMTSTSGVPSKGRIHDGSVVFLGELSESSGAMRFSPDSARIYWTSRTSSALVASDATTFAELFRIPLPAASPYWDCDRMAVNAAGTRVFVVVQGGLAIFEVTP